MSDEEPLIIVDEGWKAKVQREKEEAAAKLATEGDESAAPTADAAPEVADAPAAKAEADDAPTPDGGGAEAGEPTPFNELVASLAAQTMYALGVIAQEGQTGVTVNLDQARFAIDMLAMLREKTEGNLTADENRSLTEALSELQQIFVARLQQMQEQQMREAGVDLDNLRGPEA